MVGWSVSSYREKDLLSIEMKHAYLILAHADYPMLQYLITALDDMRNDIYVHIDKKACFDGKELHTEQSRLFVLSERIDARWGDYSLVEAEFLLFEKALENDRYAYLHLLSGADIPIKSQDYIHSYCEKHKGKEFIGFAQNTTSEELRWRAQHYFLYSKDFKSKNLWKRIVRVAFIYLQDIVRYKRSSWEIKKGAQWCSVTCGFAEFFLAHREIIGKLFHHTYCPDELVIQTLCWNSTYRDQIYSFSDEFEGCKRYIKWVNGALLPIVENDWEDMFQSDKWFARKFCSKDIIAKQLMDKWKINSFS